MTDEEYYVLHARVDRLGKARECIDLAQALVNALIETECPHVNDKRQAVRQIVDGLQQRAMGFLEQDGEVLP